MVIGRTVLIQKDPLKGNHSRNHRPVVCLPMIRKLLPEIIGEKLHQHYERKAIEGLFKRSPRKKGPIACRQNSYEELA